MTTCETLVTKVDKWITFEMAKFSKIVILAWTVLISLIKFPSFPILFDIRKINTKDFHCVFC